MAIRIDPGQPLDEEVRRIAGALLTTIAGHLDGSAAIDFHEARKAIKKLRAMLLLTRKANGRAMKEADRHLRDAARAIAGPREADAAVEMLERFIRDYPERIVDCGLGEMRLALLRQRAATSNADTEAARFAALAHCNAARATLAAMFFDGRRSDDAILAHGMEKTLKHWRGHLARAQQEKVPGEGFHDLRKAVKAHGAQLALARDFAPDDFDPRRGKVDALGEQLGELNDIADMRERLKTGLEGMPDDFETRAFDRLLRRHAARMARKALQRAERLLGDAPGALHARLRQATLKDAA